MGGEGKGVADPFATKEYKDLVDGEPKGWYPFPHAGYLIENDEMGHVSHFCGRTNCGNAFHITLDEEFGGEQGNASRIACHTELIKRAKTLHGPQHLRANCKHKPGCFYNHFESRTKFKTISEALRRRCRKYREEKP